MSVTRNASLKDAASGCSIEENALPSQGREVGALPITRSVPCYLVGKVLSLPQRLVAGRVGKKRDPLIEGCFGKRVF